MPILVRLREKDPQARYPEDFLDILRSLTPTLKQQPRLKILANSGGVNPPACVLRGRDNLARCQPGRHSHRQRTTKMCVANQEQESLQNRAGDDARSFI